MIIKTSNQNIIAIFIVLALIVLFSIKNTSLYVRNAKNSEKPNPKTPHCFTGNLTVEEKKQIYSDRWIALLAIEGKGGSIADLIKNETFSDGEKEYIKQESQNFKRKLVMNQDYVQWLSPDDVSPVNFIKIRENLKYGDNGVRMSKLTPGADGYMEIHSRAFAWAFLIYSVNMARTGMPRYAYEDEKYFYFSGGGRAYEVSDFSSGCAIEKSTSKILFWDIKQ